MINELFEDIQKHLSMLDLALASSQKIAFYAAAENLDSVNAETENRERLVNVLGTIQQKIEEQINQLNAALLKVDDIMILKCWFQDLSMWSDKMIALDRETVEILSQQKENTTKEIAHIFKNKEMFKGYNHSKK
jgi:septal ring factor EnvC (AmiA/AmiB activator)